MNNKMVMAGAIVVFIIGAIGGNYLIKAINQPPEPTEETKALIGSTVADFSMVGLDGVRENSKQWDGKVRLINYWATWCPPCKREIPALIELQQQYGSQGLQIIGVSYDQKKEQVLDYVKQADINYPILVGADEAIDISIMMGNDLGILPYTVIVNRSGEITYVRYGEISKETVESEIKPLL